MALDPKAIVQFAHSGSLGGKRRKLLFYATEDAFATVETNGYFDAAAKQFTVGKGDVIIVAYALGGTAGVKMYVVTRSGTDITLTLGIATAAA